MKRRLYFVLPSLESAKQVERDLLLAHVDDRHMHFLAKRGMDLGGLPEATMGQKTDFVHGMEIGGVAGAAAGALVGVAAFLYPILGFSLEVGFVALLALMGAAFGVWVAGMIGASAPNTRLKAFDKSIEEGNILLIVDVPKERVEEIEAIIAKHHPEAKDHGVDPQIPAFP